MKRNNNAFTLIELLAVIVILAIIAVIAIPQILNIITDSKEKSAKISAENYVRAVEMAVMNKDTDIETKNLNGTYEIKDNGKKIVSENNTIDIEFDGQGLTEGYITITNYKVTAVDFDIDKYCIRLVDGEIVVYKYQEIEKSVLIEGQEFNSKIKSLVKETSIAYNVVDEKVIWIEFYSNGLLPTGHTKESLDLLPKENVSINNDVFAYNDNGKIYIISADQISLNKDSSKMFYNFNILKDIDFRNTDTSQVVSMSHMFYGCNGLRTIELSNFNTSNVENMASMFHNCSNLLELDISNFKTNKVKYMNGMFDNCASLTTLDLSNFNTSSVINMNGMFRTCRNLTNLEISSFKTSNVTDMGQMFHSCAKLTKLDVSNFDTSSVKNMSYMFYYCSGLTTLDVNNFNTKSVINMSMMFCDCQKLTNLNINNFDTTNVTDMGSMFSNCKSLTVLDLTKFNTIQVTDMDLMFSYTGTFKVTIGENWTVKNATTTNMFHASGITNQEELLSK